MNISPNNEKIEKYLDELSNEYKTLLFQALVSRSKSMDELSISELLRIDNEIKRPLLEDYQKQQKKRKTLLLAGLLYMFMGFTMYIVYEIMNTNFMYGSRDIIPLISMVIGFVGLFISIFSFVFTSSLNSNTRHLDREKKESPALLEYEVITKWRELEGIVNDISIETNVKTPRSIIEFLAENQFIDSSEYSQLKDFLKMRNNVAHATKDTYSSKEIIEMMSKIEVIIEKVKKIV